MAPGGSSLEFRGGLEGYILLLHTYWLLLSLLCTYFDYSLGERKKLYFRAPMWFDMSMVEATSGLVETELEQRFKLK